MTRTQDVQDIYGAIPVAEKSLYWIEGTDRRFDGHNFFGLHPEVPIEWFDKHISSHCPHGGRFPRAVPSFWPMEAGRRITGRWQIAKGRVATRLRVYALRSRGSEAAW